MSGEKTPTCRAGAFQARSRENDSRDREERRGILVSKWEPAGSRVGLGSECQQAWRQRGPRPAPARSRTCRPGRKNPSASPLPAHTPARWELSLVLAATPTDGISEPRARRTFSPARGSKTVTTPLTRTHRVGCDSGGVNLEVETRGLTVTTDGLRTSSEGPGRAEAGGRRSADRLGLSREVSHLLRVNSSGIL